MRTRYFFLSLLIFITNSLFGGGQTPVHLYITLNGTGNGSSWTNARGFSTMWNTGEVKHWSSLTAGDIVEIEGGTYPVYSEINCTSLVGSTGAHIIIKGSEDTGHNGTVTLQGSTNNLPYVLNISSSKYVDIDRLYIENAYQANITVNSSENCTIKRCSLFVKGYDNSGHSGGVSGIEADKTKNLLIQSNTITTINNNDFQLDCIKVGGLGTGAAVNTDEIMIIRDNVIKNSSACTTSTCHDDCIQFYTSTDKYYNYGDGTYQIVKIYRNWIEQTESGDTQHNGIIIGGFKVAPLPSDNNWKQGKMTKWYIWSNIIKHQNGTDLINFAHIDPEEIKIFNNTFYNGSSTDLSELFVYHNKWTPNGNTGNDLNSVLRNTLIKNNIFYSASSGKLLKFGNYDNNIYENMEFGNNVNIDNNCYWNGSTTSYIVTLYQTGNSTHEYNFNNWKTHTTFDGQSINVDPQFINSDLQLNDQGTDYSLISQCVDGGERLSFNITDYDKDYDGDTRPTTMEPGYWDMGAWNTDFYPMRSDIALKKENLTTFPSPFNPDAIINFEVAKEGHTSVDIYDILGKKIISLVDDFKYPGKYSVRFNASGLSSGTYFCLFRSASTTSVKKLLLLK